MTDSRSRPVRKSGAKRPTVGGSERGNGLPVLFIVGVVAVVLAFIVLITVASDKLSGGSTPAVPGASPTDTPTTEATAAPTTTTAPTSSPTTPATVGPDGSVQVTCGDILAPLDKQHVLAPDCEPADLVALPAEYSSGVMRMRSEAAGAIVEMFEAAKTDGYALYVNSAYRSYAEQAATYDYWVSVNGKEYADRTSARPGHSEHQLGNTADVGWVGCELECTIGTPEAAWIAENSYKFGFIVSYPDGKEDVTGYAAEPWHVRYVGKDVAQQVHDSGLTLHEFLLR
ncbi:MAG: D-alanyl-D-alanine carboxypeptidase family protein [Dehalococcoidia bacterium]